MLKIKTMWNKFLKWIDQNITNLFVYNQFEDGYVWKYFARLIIIAVIIPIWLLYIVATLIGNLLR